MRFTYCPDCGRKLIDKVIGDEGYVPYCEGCKRPLFDMFSSCVIVLVTDGKGKVVLLRQSYISNEYYNLVSSRKRGRKIPHTEKSRKKSV